MQHALTALEIVGQLNKVAIDSRSIIKEFALTETEPTIEELTRIAKKQSFKARLKNLPLEKIVKNYPTPIIAHTKDDKFITILKADEEKKELLIFSADKKEPTTISYEAFEKISDSKYIVLKHKMFTQQVKFGFMWFYKQIINYKKVIAEIFLASFVIQLFGLVTPLFTQVILDKVLVHRSLTTLDVLAIAFVAVAIFDMLLNLARNYILVHTTSKIDAKLGAKLFYHLLALPFSYFENRKVGNIISRVRELDQIREFIANRSVTVILDILFSFVFIAVMFLYSVKLTLIVIAFVFVIAIIYLIFTPELRKRLEEKFQMGAHSNSYLVESITGIQTVKSLAVEGNMRKQWEDHLAKYVDSGFRLSNLSNVLGGFSGTLQKLMTITILYLGVSLVLEQKLSVGQLIAFQMFANQFTAPILRLVGMWNEFQQTLLSVDRIGDILNTPTEQKNDKAITLPKIQGHIRFEDISFSYGPNLPTVLNNINIEIKSGMSVGLVGRSGSGKSTITKLLQRLYITNSGAIYMDSIDIRHLNPSWLRHNIGVVLQENYLFSGSIKDNIALSYTNASMERIIQAATIAGAHEFISELPEGYETEVGERGSSLSGGQKQRIAIARALITDPKILVFDEATSALDYESEKIIQTNLNKIKHGRTMIIVAHRLTTVQDCDMIVVFDRGKIIEKGSHEELMSMKSYYYRLYTRQ